MSTRVSDIGVSIKRMTGETSIGLHIYDEQRDRTFNYKLDRKQLTKLIDDLEEVEAQAYE